MPNIGTLLREEIARLSRREARSQVDSTRKATAQHRREIAGLKRQVAELERRVKSLARRAFDAPPATASASPAKPVRFVAKGLRSQRNRWGLSAADFGKLVGVSAQSIYNWERELARPRGEQLSKLAVLRGMGKREAANQLKQLVAATAKSPRKGDSIR